MTRSGGSLLLLLLFVLPWCNNALQHLKLSGLSAGHGGREVIEGGAAAADNDDDVQELYFDQQLDHFNRQNHQTFSQRYFVNSRYFTAAAGPASVFLCVCGEGPPVDITVVTDSVHCSDAVELAEQEGALVLALEHRYYGESVPFSNDADGSSWTTEHLQWLSSQQALADISVFHGFISERLSLPGDAKWVTWGGSYPGMLAAWARVKYPHLIYGAVSSSSPLQATLDFEEYNHVVRASLADSIVGGSEACAAAVEKGHAIIGDMLATGDGRDALAEHFGLCSASPLERQEGQKLFSGDGVVYFPVQENDPSCTEPLCNIAKVCDVMTDESLGCPVKRLAHLRQAQRQQQQLVVQLQRKEGEEEETEECEDFAKAIEAAETYPTDTSNPDRAWLYQTCTEFGFYQPCEREGCPYTLGLHTLQDDLDMCGRAFGITAAEVTDAVTYTNEFYGGSGACHTRIVFPNGDIDPWYAQGVLEPTPCHHSPPSPEEEVVLSVRGASHHFWTHPSKGSDSQAVVEARERIWEQVRKWLSEDDGKEEEEEEEEEEQALLLE